MYKLVLNHSRTFYYKSWLIFFRLIVVRKFFLIINMMIMMTQWWLSDSLMTMMTQFDSYSYNVFVIFHKGLVNSKMLEQSYCLYVEGPKISPSLNKWDESTLVSITEITKTYRGFTRVTFPWPTDRSEYTRCCVRKPFKWKVFIFISTPYLLQYMYTLDLCVYCKTPSLRVTTLEKFYTSDILV